MQRVHFVENEQRLLAERAQFLRHCVHRFDVFIHARMAQIDHVNEQIRLAHFLERGLERLDQHVRQILA